MRRPRAEQSRVGAERMKGQMWWEEEGGRRQELRHCVVTIGKQLGQ